MRRAAYMREYYRTHPEYAERVKARARAQHEQIMADRELREKERARHREKEKRLRARRKPVDPVKKRARWLAESAVRCGRLIEKYACEDCGGRENRIEMHHEDYTKPLAVRWLCSLCHGLTHRRKD